MPKNVQPMTNTDQTVRTVLVAKVGFGGFDGGAGFGGFEDIFSSFFGGGATRNPNAPRQGDDLQYRVNLSFEEAVLVLKRNSLQS